MQGMLEGIYAIGACNANEVIGIHLEQGLEVCVVPADELSQVCVSTWEVHISPAVWVVANLLE